MGKHLIPCEYRLAHYLSICDAIREDIPFDHRSPYDTYAQRFAEAHETYRKFLQLPKWKQSLYRKYYQILDYLRKEPYDHHSR